jgi:hypothetical protein
MNSIFLFSFSAGFFFCVCDTGNNGALTLAHADGNQLERSQNHSKADV